MANYTLFWSFIFLGNGDDIVDPKSETVEVNMPDYPTMHAIQVEFNRWMDRHVILGMAFILTTSLAWASGLVLFLFRPINESRVRDIIREELKRHG